MFTVHCPRHGRRVLIFTSGIARVRNTEHGIEVDYRCTCGQRGIWRTGRGRAEHQQPQPAAGAVGAEYAVLRSMAGAGGGLA